MFIGGSHVISLTENEFNNHSSVQMIETIYSNSSFQFKHINTKDVQDLFENLNPRKSCSDTGLMPKLMKIIDKVFELLLGKKLPIILTLLYLQD